MWVRGCDPGQVTFRADLLSDSGGLDPLRRL